MPLMGCLSSDSFIACSSLCLSIQAVSYLTPTGVLTPSLTSLFWSVTAGALPETTWSGAVWYWLKSYCRSVNADGGSDCIAARVAGFSTGKGLIGTLRTDETLRKTPSEQSFFALDFGAIAVEKLKQVVAFLELDFAFGHDLAPQELCVRSA